MTEVLAFLAIDNAIHNIMDHNVKIFNARIRFVTIILKICQMLHVCFVVEMEIVLMDNAIV